MFRKWFGKRAQPEHAGTAQAAQNEQGDFPLIDVALIRIGGPPELDWMLIDVSSLDIQRGLGGWRWVDLEGLTAIAVSAFGDVFFQTPDRSIQMLDTIEGRLKDVAESLSGFTAQLQETEARDDLLLGGIVNAARAQGIRLEEGECYDFRVAPVLGGEMTVDAIHKLSFVVKLHVAGQLHEQVKDLPPGTAITGLTISD